MMTQERDLIMLRDAISHPSNTLEVQNNLLEALDRIIPMVLPQPPEGYKYTMTIERCDGNGIITHVRNVNRRNVGVAIRAITGDDK